jgi:hypothetical protein
MKRSELKQIIENSAKLARCSASTVKKLVASVDDAEMVLTGEFNATVAGKFCGCPATLAGYYNPEMASWSKYVQGMPLLRDKLENFAYNFDGAIPAALISYEDVLGIHNYILIEDD